MIEGIWGVAIPAYGIDGGAPYPPKTYGFCIVVMSAIADGWLAYIWPPKRFGGGGGGLTPPRLSAHALKSAGETEPSA